MKKGRTVLQAKRFGIHSCHHNTSLVTAIRIMVDEEVGSLVATDDQGYVTGVITRADILRAHIERDDWAARQVKDHMARDFPIVKPDSRLIDAARAMLDHPLGQVVVVLDEGGKHRPVAMLTDSDLAYHLVKGG